MSSSDKLIPLATSVSFLACVVAVANRDLTLPFEGLIILMFTVSTERVNSRRWPDLVAWKHSNYLTEFAGVGGSAEAFILDSCSVVFWTCICFTQTLIFKIIVLTGTSFTYKPNP